MQILENLANLANFSQLDCIATIKQSWFLRNVISRWWSSKMRVKTLALDCIVILVVCLAYLPCNNAQTATTEAATTTTTTTTVSTTTESTTVTTTTVRTKAKKDCGCKNRVKKKRRIRRVIRKKLRTTFYGTDGGYRRNRSERWERGERRGNRRFIRSGGEETVRRRRFFRF